MKYTWDGEQKQMEHAGLFDLLSGKLLYRDEADVFEYDVRTIAGQNPADYIYDAFEGWTFTKTLLNPPLLGQI